MSISGNISDLKKELPDDVLLVAVSKTKSDRQIMEAYETGHRDFGENKVQEMASKYERLPKDIKWHLIGHLQRNKVKYIAPFVHLIHAIDSFKLLKEIDKQASKHGRIVSCLLQIKIAEEDTKFGMSQTDAHEILESEELKKLRNIRISGLMGMATFTSDEAQVKKEFDYLSSTYEKLQSHRKENVDFKILSMGMSGDYELAIECGSNMVRVGSKIFGERS